MICPICGLSYTSCPAPLDYPYHKCTLHILYIAPSIVAFTLYNDYLRFRHFVDKPVLPIDSPAPIAAPVFLQWLRLSDSLKRLPDNILHKYSNPLYNLRVFCEPIVVFVQRL
jgi:hypothetical protein